MGRQEELIALNTPIDGKQYTFTLGEGSGALVLTHAPDGWDDDEFTLQRDMIRFGVFRKFSSLELKFVEEGRDYLEAEYEATGVNASTKLTVTKRNSMEIVSTYFIGYIDYSTYKITELSVDVQIIDGSFTDLLLSRAKTEVDLLGSKTIDGEIVTVLPMQKITIPEIKLNQLAGWLGTDDDDYTTAYTPLMQVDRSEFLETASVSGSQPMLFIDATQDYPGIKFDFNLNLVLDQIPGIDAEYTVQLFLQRYNGGTYVEHVYASIAYTALGTWPEYLNLTDSVTFDLYTGDSLKFILIITNLSGAGGKITHTDITASLTAIDKTILSKEIDAVLYHEDFEKIIELTTGFSGRFKSDFFGRTDIGYAADGVIGAITSGRFIRGYYLLNQTMPISLEKLLKSVQSIYCLGMGIQLIDGVEKVVIEPMSYFFSDKIILDVSNRIAPETIIKEYYPELSFNRISVGYNSFDYRALGGVYEFNSTSKFTTPIRPVDKELQIVSEYRADMSGVINLLIEPSENKDVSGESDIFILDTIKSESGYIVRSVEEFEQTEDLSNRDILINLAISPKRNLLRWGAYLRGFLDKYLTSFLIFQTSDKNTKLSSTETGQSAVVENADILVSDLIEPLWVPEIVQFEVPQLENDLTDIQANIYGLVKYTENDYGWILTYKAKNENRKSEFTLLRCNTAYVTPGGDIPVYPASLNVNVIIDDLPTDYTKFIMLLVKDGVLFSTVYISQENQFELISIPYGNYTAGILVDESQYELITVVPVELTISTENLHETVNIHVRKLSQSGTGTVTVTKVITGVETDETYFDITISGTDGEMIEQFGQVRLGEPLTFEDLPFGAYEITEAVPDGYTLSSITPSTVVLSSGNASESVEIVNDKAIKYGALYNWYAASKNGGSGVGSIAPEGWHVPTSDDFTALLNHFVSLSLYSGNLKEIGSDFWDDPNTQANSYAYFNWRGSGRRLLGGAFTDIKRYNSLLGVGSMPNFVYSLRMQYDFDTALLEVGEWRTDGHSIRLIKDNSTNTGTVTDIDGNIYPTTKIGDQVWMAANLAVTKFNDGTPIPNVTDNATWAALTTEGYCWYDNDITNK